MNKNTTFISSLKKESLYLSKSCGGNYRNIVRGFGRFFIFKEFYMNQIKVINKQTVLKKLKNM